MAINPAATAAREAARNQTTGQFGHQQHSAPDRAALTAARKERRHAKLAQRLAGYAQGELTSVAAAEHAAAERVVARSEAFARGEGVRRALRWHEHEDLSAMALLELAERVGTSEHPATINQLERAGGLHRNTTRALGQRLQFPNSRHTDVKATAILQDREQAFRNAHRRAPSREEYDTIAEEVRLSFPAGQRPHIGFQRQNHAQVSLDSPLSGDGDTTLADTLEAPTPNLGDTGLIGGGLGERLDSYEQAIADWGITPIKERGARPKREEYGFANSNVWGQLAAASSAELPLPAAGTLTSTAQATLRRTIRSTPGGVPKLARDYLNGDASEAEAAPLFAPFGNLEPAARDRVAVLFTDHPEVADRLWGSAVREAGR